MKNANKNNFSYRLFSIVLSFSLFNFNLAAAANDNAKTDPANDYDEVIVLPEPSLPGVKRIDRMMRARGILRYQKVNDNAYVVPLGIVTNQEDKEARINELKNTGLFRTVEPNFKMYLDQINQKSYVKVNLNSRPGAPKGNSTGTGVAASPVISDSQANGITPNDKDFSQQYYLKEINATKAWNTTKGDPSVLVAVLDTGVDASHPDLTGNVEADPTGQNTTDIIGHGTEVSGVIGADTNNNLGIAGIAWNARILPIKITDDNGQAKVSAVLAALDQAYTAGAKIVHISLSTNQFSQALQDGMQQAKDRGLLVISTSGNTGDEQVRYPAGCPGVVGVGSIKEDKSIESYSTTGTHVSLVAPGTSVFTTSLNSDYASVTGTSFSAPQVSGTAALIWSLNPNLSSDDVRQILFSSAADLGDSGKDNTFGYGLLDTQKAVELAKARK